jgi:hypothetical protein
MFLFCFCFGRECGAIMFLMVTGATISRILGRQYRAVLSLSFFDVYEGLSCHFCLLSKPLTPIKNLEMLFFHMDGD